MNQFRSAGPEVIGIGGEAPSGYIATSANFTGNSRLQFNTISMADGTQFTASMWLRPSQVGVVRHVMQGRTGTGGPQWAIQQGSGDQWQFVNAGSVIVCNGNTSTISLTANLWYHILFSFDLSNTSKRHVYFNNVSALANWPTYNTTVNLTLALGNLFIGNNDSNETPYAGDMAEIWVDDTYIDFSILANREMFALAGKPLDLGTNGSAKTGYAPDCYLRFLSGALNVNSGADAGTATVTGTITSGATTVQY